jgi:ribosomal protein S18 acetylase RimI-like enzyme
VIMRVAELDLGDDATLDRLLELQRASYAVEAELIGADVLPPMRETPAELRGCGETFLGAGGEGELLGAISFRRAGGTVDIHRLVVDPAAFRRGVATALLDALEARERDATHWTVGTGAENAPARALYERRGFTATEERVVPGDIRWVRLDRAGGIRRSR